MKTSNSIVKRKSGDHRQQYLFGRDEKERNDIFEHAAVNFPEFQPFGTRTAAGQLDLLSKTLGHEIQFGTLDCKVRNRQSGVSHNGSQM